MKKNRTEQEITCEKKKTSIGGQALMEGLMMIGPDKLAMAVRLPDQSIHVETSPIGKSSAAARIPFLRGSVKIFRQMVTGTRYLMKSAQFLEDEIVNNPLDSTPVTGNAIPLSAEQPSAVPVDPVLTPKKKKGRIELLLAKHSEILLYLSAIIGIMLSVGLFILLPNLITNLTLGQFIRRETVITNRIMFSVFEGFLRISIFIGYLAIATRLKDIRRVWMYHGAEHKTIACYESKMPLTTDNVRKFSKHHPRCGTAFMFVIVIISIILFSFIPRINIIADMILRLLLVPVLASLSYELIRLIAKHDNWFTRFLAWPGLALQRLTTKEPDDSMLEVAIAAMLPVIPEGEHGDEW
jgi:uncharacterized protein YqhQ